jgi:hypothetical protein
VNSWRDASVVPSLRFCGEHFVRANQEKMQEEQTLLFGFVLNRSYFP